MLGTTYQETFVALAATEDADKPKIGKDGLPVWTTNFKELEPMSEKQKELVRFMHEAAKKNRSNQIEKIIRESFVNPNLRDHKGWTALLRAAKANAIATVEVLIEGHADLNTVTKSKNSALHKAAKQGHQRVVGALLEAKAEPDMQNDGGATPLMIAVMHKREEIAEALIKHKADVNVQKDVGYTALMIAARLGRLRECQLLLSVRANVELHDKQHETALAKAQKKRRDDIAQLLLDHGADAKHGYVGSVQVGNGKERHHGDHKSHGHGYPQGQQRAPTAGGTQGKLRSGSAAAAVPLRKR